MTDPAVTLLLPVFNSETTLMPTLDSLFGQSFGNFELLVIDDGSTDATPQLLKRVEDPRLRVLRNPERLRLSGALNLGIEEARSPLIARMDADDLARPQRLQVQKAYMDAHPEVAMCGSWTRHFGAGVNKTERYPAFADAIRAFSLFNCPFAHPTVMLRTDVFREGGLTYDASYYPTEDYELWTRVVHRFPCANVPEILLDYRVHGQSMTGSDWENMDEQARRLMRRQYADLEVEVSEREAALNRDIGMARVTPKNLPTAVGWLESLREKNRRREFCPPMALEDELRERLFHICMNATRGGAKVLDAYRESRLWDGGSPPMMRLLLMKASVLKRGGCS